MTREPCSNADGSPKRAYRSSKTAQRQARLTRNSGADAETIHVYLCPQSTGRRAHWHVGHNSREQGPWR